MLTICSSRTSPPQYLHTMTAPPLSISSTSFMRSQTTCLERPFAPATLKNDFCWHQSPPAFIFCSTSCRRMSAWHFWSRGQKQTRSLPFNGSRKVRFKLSFPKSHLLYSSKDLSRVRTSPHAVTSPTLNRLPHFEGLPT